MKLKLITKGGSGSGNFNHAGIPGQVGGSAPSGEGGGKTSGKLLSSADDYYAETIDWNTFDLLDHTEAGSPA